MFKILITIILIGYVIHKAMSFLFGGMFKSYANRGQFGQQAPSENRRQAPNSNLNIDNIPGAKTKKGKGFSGGEYVDYEEVS